VDQREPTPIFDTDRVARRRAGAWRVLVVEDDPGVRRSLERYLTEAGFEVMVAADVDEALDRLSGAAVSAAVVDMRMPDVTGRHRTGIEVLSYLRLQPQLSAVPAIIFTGFTPTPAQQADIDEYGGHVLLKGHSYAALVEKLDALLGGARSVR